MILPDINLLIHAHNLDSPCHHSARKWWDACLAGTEGVGLAWIVILGFIRIATHPRILSHPMEVDEVLNRIETWLDLPHFHIPEPSGRHFQTLQQLLRNLGTAANLTTDAHLATLAIERGYVLYTTDADFTRFPGLRWLNPLYKARS